MFPTLARIAFFGALLFAFVMATLPQPPMLPGEPSDKVQHVLAFVTLAALAAAAFPRTPLLRLGLALSAFGALIEFVQLLPALNREGDVYDWLADTAAIAVALTVASVARRRGTDLG